MKKRQKNVPQPGSALRLDALRARRKRRKIYLGALLTVALAGVIFYMTGLYGASVAVLGDALDSAAIALQPGPGWPVKTGVADVFDAQPLEGGFAALGETDLLLYSGHGSQLRRIQHGYAWPGLSVAGGRLCLYNRTGTELRVESRTRTLFTKTFEQPILAARMGQGGAVAVLTRSARYTGELIVYDRQFDEIFHWYATDTEGTPAMLAVSKAENRVAVGCLSPKDGVMGVNVLVLDTGREKPLATVELPGSRVLKLEWLAADSFLVVTDQSCVVYTYKGKEKARYSFGGRTLAAADVEGQNTALLFSGGELVLLNEKMAPSAELAPEGGVSQVVLGRKAAYCLTKDSVLGYSMQGEPLGEQSFSAQPLALVRAGRNVIVLYGAQAAELALTPPGEERDAAPTPTPLSESGANSDTSTTE